MMGKRKKARCVTEIQCTIDETMGEIKDTIYTIDDIMSKIPVLDKDTIEILKNCDLTNNK